MTTDWRYNGVVDLSKFDSFVYLITNNVTGQKYVGKKTLWKRQGLVVSDYLTYWGSSELLLADIQMLGEQSFTREIIHWCTTRSDASYKEAEEQFARNVLGEKLRNGLFAYYNRNILSKFFSAPGQKVERVVKKPRVKKVTIGIRMKRKIWNSDSTQRQLANEFDISIAMVAKIQKEKPE